jgi:hypothetical protein
MEDDSSSTYSENSFIKKIENLIFSENFNLCKDESITHSDNSHPESLVEIVENETEESNFLEHLIETMPTLETVQPGFSIESLKEVTRIIGWIDPNWQKVYEIMQSPEAKYS